MENGLSEGNLIAPISVITRERMSCWKYASECDEVLWGLAPGAQLEVVEVCETPGRMWVRAHLPGRHPEASLKISNEEYTMNFRRVE